MATYRPQKRRRSRRRTWIERAALAVCVALGLSLPFVWEGSPIAVEGADPLVLALLVAAMALSMVAWRRHGSQGSLSWMMFCLIAGVALALGLSYLAESGSLNLG